MITQSLHQLGITDLRIEKQGKYRRVIALYLADKGRDEFRLCIHSNRIQPRDNRSQALD